MNLTPQSMRSPVSPFDEQTKQSFDAQSQSTCYPAASQPEPSTMGESARGLGIYHLSSVPRQESTVQELPPSPQQSENWSHHSSMIEDNSYPQTTQPPNIFTAAFDPFSEYNSHASGSMMSATSEEAPGLVFCHTPPSTNMPSHRSSVSSSCSPAPQQLEYYTPRVKVEDYQDWHPSPGNDQVLQRSSMHSQSFSPCSSGLTGIHGTIEDLYKSPAVEWAKPAPAPYPMPYNNNNNNSSSNNNMMGEEQRTRFDGASVLSSVNRIKKKRQRTTPDEATHECGVCGKLFKRSYNWKSHMETHNPDRKYPHPCPASVDGQPCSKKFQRKTDLDRHYDSVHLKARNHRCNRCGHRFARRDTLRRHTEDGCPKRFDLGVRETTAPPPARWSLPGYPQRNRSYSTPLGGNTMPPPSTLHPGSTHPASQPYCPPFVSSVMQATQPIFAQ